MNCSIRLNKLLTRMKWGWGLQDVVRRYITSYETRGIFLYFQKVLNSYFPSKWKTLIHVCILSPSSDPFLSIVTLIPHTRYFVFLTKQWITGETDLYASFWWITNITDFYSLYVIKLKMWAVETTYFLSVNVYTSAET